MSLQRLVAIIATDRGGAPTKPQSRGYVGCDTPLEKDTHSDPLVRGGVRDRRVAIAAQMGGASLGDTPQKWDVCIVCGYRFNPSEGCGNPHCGGK
jgi:hypothetical protein